MTVAAHVPPEAAPFALRYLDNLAALYAHDPELAARIDALPFAELPVLERARDGEVTLQVRADDGKPVYVHSRYRPLEEARALVEAQTRVDAEQAGTDGAPDLADLENPTFFVAGLGLGYHVVELERRFARPLVIVAEDDLRLLKAAFCVNDFGTLLRDRRLALLTTADKVTLHQRLRSALTHLMLGIRFVTLACTNRYHAQFHADMRALMRDFVAYARVQMCSLLRHARATCENIAYNLTPYVRNPGVEVLAGRARGYPAILVAAGPSLRRNIDQLAELRSRAVIIGVQTVLKTLLAKGMPPHFVTSLDYHEISAQFFHGIEDFGGVTLVAEPKAAHKVLDTFTGPTHLLRSDFADDLLREAAPARAELKAGSTVAHLSFYLAEHLGCDPIILVGQDLSFTEAMYYPAGMQIERIWQPELGRFQTIEMKQWERIIRSRANLHVVTDIRGRKAYTDDQLFTYAEQFQADFMECKARVIHACEGGMRFAGTEVMTLAEAARRYCTRPLPPDLCAADWPAPPADLKERVTAALERRLEELRETRAIAVETADLLERLAGLVERPSEFNRLIVRVDELRSRMQRYDHVYKLVTLVSQLAELRRIQADRAIRDTAHETPATARRRLGRDRAFVREFIEGCDYLLGLVPAALRRVQEQL